MELYSLVSLLVIAGNMKSPKSFLRDMLVGKTKNHETASFEIHTKNARRVTSPYSGKYSEGAFITRDGFKVAEVEPACFKPYTRAVADSLLKAHFGQNPYINIGNPEERAANKLKDEIMFLDSTITRGENRMLAELVTTGIIPIIGEGEDRAISYGDANIETLTGTDKFSDPACDPIEYLEEKITEVGQETGIVIENIIFDYKAYSAYRKNPLVQEFLKQTNGTIVVLEAKDVSEGGRYVGEIPDLGVSLYVFKDWYEDPSTKEERPYIPEGGLLGLPNGLIEMHYGAIQIEPEKADELPQLIPLSRVPYSWKQPGNNPRNIQMFSKPLPVPKDARGWFYTQAV